jgi:hypothetical protein
MSGKYPKPLVDSDSKPFWDGLADKTLMIQQCQDCHKHIFYPRYLCPHCFSENITWKKASGRGEIYSYTVVHRAFGPYADETPYVVAIVELEEGVRMMTRIIGDREKIAIGKQVEVRFVQLEEDLILPYFELI